MESSIGRLLGNQFHRNITGKSWALTSAAYSVPSHPLRRHYGGGSHHNHSAGFGCMSFPSASSSKSVPFLRPNRTQNQYKSMSSSSFENVVQPDREVNLCKGTSITDFLFKDLGKWQDATAMECALTGRSFTHGMVYQIARNFGAALQQMGLKKGDVLAVCLPNMPEYPTVTFGAWFARLTVNLVNPTYTPYEIGKQLVDCEAKVCVTLSLFLPYIQQAQATHPTTLADMKIILIGEAEEGCHSYGDMIRVDSSSANLASSSDKDLNTEEDVVLLPYSSGTTGPPKGVQLTHANLVSNCIQTLESINARPFSDGNPQEVGMGLLPFFHIMAFEALALTTFQLGGKVICLPRFESDTFVDCLKNYKFTLMHLVAPLFHFINSHPEIGKEEFSELHTIFNGACPTSRVLIDRLLEKAGKFVLIQEGYGMTESSPLTLMIPRDSKNEKIGSVGKPVPNTLVKVVNPETGKAVGPNERGELWIKGPQVMKGYYKNEKATKETITEDGWLKTGDIGFYEEDKHFHVVDRLKELIKVKGIQVSPSELESTLRNHPAVADVAVVGVPHKELGEAPRAFVVLRESASQTTKEKDIVDFLKEKLSSHKQLAGGAQFISEIPKAASGKILRKDLKQAYLEGR